jgi:hypothetical protein
MVEQQQPPPVPYLTEYQRRKDAEPPRDVWYERDDADADDINAIDRQETCIEYARDEDVAEIGQYCVY